MFLVSYYKLYTCISKISSPAEVILQYIRKITCLSYLFMYDPMSIQMVFSSEMIPTNFTGIWFLSSMDYNMTS